MDEQKRALAAKLEEEKKKRQQPQESVYTKLAKSGWLGTKAKISAESEK